MGQVRTFTSVPATVHFALGAVSDFDTPIVVNSANGAPYTIVNGVVTLLNLSAGSAADAWPIGSVYLSTRSTTPATTLGFGTWTAIEGKFIAGVKAADPEFGAGVSGGATGTTYTPSGTNDLSLFIAKGTVSWPATAPAFVGTTATASASVSWPTGVPVFTGLTATASASVSWPTGVPVFAGTTVTASASVNWPAGVPTFAGTAHQHGLPMYSTGATSISFLPTGTFGVGTAQAGALRVSATATGPIVAANAASGQVYLSQTATAAGAISYPASVPQAVVSVIPAGVLSWPATAPAAVVSVQSTGTNAWPATAPAAVLSVAPAGTNTWPTGQPVFTGATGSGSGIFSGVAKAVAILPPYLTVYMWERVS